MNLSLSMQSVKDLVRFPTQDPQWKNKLLVGSLLALASAFIPVLPALPLMGYLARMIRAGARNDDPARLPEWDNWEDLFVDGLRQAGVVLILMLPGILLIMMGWGLYMGTVIAMPALESSGSDGAMMVSLFGGMFSLFILMAFGMLLLVAAMILLAPAMAHVAVKRQFSALFRVGEWWQKLRAHFGSFLVAWAVFVVVYSLLTLVTQILYMSIIFCMVIPFVSIPLGVYAAWLVYRLIGQAYGEAGGEVKASMTNAAVPGAVG